VYADALLMLAEHDTALNWRKLAEGITVSGQQQQYPEGHEFVGCLPDSIGLSSQQRYPWNINPAPLVDLRRKLEGRPG
jgi:hypothetical protein